MTRTPPPVRSRRPRRLGIEAHTEFVGTLVSELDTAVASLRVAARELAEQPAKSEVELLELSNLDRSAGDVLRLVRLLEAIDGPAESRRRRPVSLPDTLAEAAKGLGLEVVVRGAAGRGQFMGDAESVRLGAELVVLAFAGDDRRLQVGIANDRLVVLEGAFDPADERKAWQLRCGRRVLEGENCWVRLISGRDGYRLEIRALEP